MQHLEDVEAGVPADEVRECQRTHRVVHPELHDRVDRRFLGNPFVQQKIASLNQRHQHAVADEAGKSRHSTGVFPIDSAKRLGLGPSSHPTFEGANDLDELHQRHGVHEVHAEDLVGALGAAGGDLRDREATRCSWRGSRPA